MIQHSHARMQAVLERNTKRKHPEPDGPAREGPDASHCTSHALTKQPAVPVDGLQNEVAHCTASPLPSRQASIHGSSSTERRAEGRDITCSSSGGDYAESLPHGLRFDSVGCPNTECGSGLLPPAAFLSWHPPVWLNPEKTCGHMTSTCGRYRIHKSAVTSGHVADPEYTVTRLQPGKIPPAIWLGYRRDLEEAKKLCAEDVGSTVTVTEKPRGN